MCVCISFFNFRWHPTFFKLLFVFLWIFLLVAVLKGISDGMSRGKKSEEMENLVKSSWQYWLISSCLEIDKKNNSVWWTISMWITSCTGKGPVENEYETSRRISGSEQGYYITFCSTSGVLQNVRALIFSLFCAFFFYCCSMPLKRILGCLTNNGWSK